MTLQASSPAFRTQPLTPDAIRSGLKTERFGQTLHVYDKTESTNAAAHALAEKGAPEGTVVLANTQTRGRGRMGRHWISPPDVNLYFSIILRPGGDPRRVGLWTLAAANAVAHAIEQTVGLPARLKWPNDLLIHHKKVAGLLLESIVQKGRIRYLVLGIGVNVNLLCETLPEPLRDSVSSLRQESGHAVDRIGLLQRALEALEIQYRSFQNEAAGKILKTYTARSETLGRPVRVQEQDHEWTGIAEGLTPEGALILRRGDREEVIIRSDNVVHVRPSHAARD
ncbi:MAG TPA: biotin--[acetyl-CoA-carboxylase] ligase [Nitrospiria bacterium]|nr:biotin--[acetyl-CoA-carboxylase] ligase [Nitrospiria bacterium]